jgi:hypothetical protein
MIAHHETEFSLAELIDHPVLGLAAAEEGFDRRSLERILDAESGLGWHRSERDDFTATPYFPTA